MYLDVDGGAPLHLQRGAAGVDAALDRVGHVERKLVLGQRDGARLLVRNVHSRGHARRYRSGGGRLEGDRARLGVQLELALRVGHRLVKVDGRLRVGGRVLHLAAHALELGHCARQLSGIALVRVARLQGVRVAAGLELLGALVETTDRTGGNTRGIRGRTPRKAPRASASRCASLVALSTRGGGEFLRSARLREDTEDGGHLRACGPRALRLRAYLPKSVTGYAGRVQRLARTLVL
mmetsp:Transcript_21689/g.67164  ORF Transcript_21689/g.67164 Transcript_21689/m.67164 type:complete len:237 (+) Transcript_21689:641-1351(+)